MNLDTCKTTDRQQGTSQSDNVADKLYTFCVSSSLREGNLGPKQGCAED